VREIVLRNRHPLLELLECRFSAAQNVTATTIRELLNRKSLV